MSDAVTISLISAISAFAAAVVGVLNNLTGRKNATHLAETKTAMVYLERQTNGMKTELVALTGKASYARGHLDGTAEANAHNSP